MGSRLIRACSLIKDSLPPLHFVMSNSQFTSFAKTFCSANPPFTPEIIIPLLEFAHANDDKHPKGLFNELMTAMTCSIHGITRPQKQVEEQTPTPKEAEKPKVDETSAYITAIHASSSIPVVEYDWKVDHSSTTKNKKNPQKKKKSCL